MRLMFATVTAVIALLPAPSLAADGTMAVTPASSSDGASGDKMVCQREPRTGSRLTARICKTAAEWDRIAEQHRRDLDEFTDQARNNTGSTGDK